VELSHLPMDLREHRFDVQRREKTELRTLEEHEKDYIAWVLDQVKGNKTRAAEILGIDRVSLWRKLKRYQLDLGGES
jgi:transcriptional regulator with PAS, ATPase and Fis domain